MFKSYRKWGEPTIIEGSVMEPKCFLVENMEEFVSGELLCGVGSIAVVPSTGKIYYLSYDGEWKLWGGEADSGSDSVAIEYVDNGTFIILQKTWGEILELFNAGKRLGIGTEIVTNIYSDFEDPDPRYFVETNSGQYYYLADSEDGYPKRPKGGFA